MQLIKKSIFIVLLISLTSTLLVAQGAKEIQQVTEGSKSLDIEVLMKTLHFVENRLTEIQLQFEQSLEEMESNLIESHTAGFQAISKLEPKIWETDNEFEERLANEEIKFWENLKQKYESAYEQLESESLIDRQPYEAIFIETYENLMVTRVIVLDGNSLEAQDYRRNERKWPISVSSLDPLLQFDNLEVIIDFNRSQNVHKYEIDLRQEILDFDLAVKTNNLSGTIDWVVDKNDISEPFFVAINEVVITNEINGIQYEFPFDEPLIVKYYQVEGTKIDNMTIESVRTPYIGAKRVFRIANGAEPESLDPQMIQGASEHRIYEAIFEGLVAYDPETAKAVPGLAESWEISDDGTQYTFHLRDAVWSDGVPLTAQTVVDSWIRELDPATGTPYAWFPSMFVNGARKFNYGIAGPEAVGIRALDDKTFQLDLLGSFPYFIDVLAHYSFAVVPLHAIEKHGDQWTLPENFVGNGPYILNEYVPQSYISVVPNESYWDTEAVQLDEVIFYAIDDNNTAYNMYLNGEIDWMTTVPVDQIEAASLRLDYHRAPQLSTYYYVFQVQKAPFDDARVRKALAMSFDRQALVDHVSRGEQLPAWSIVPEMAGYASLGDPIYDVEQARQLLTEAGYPNGAGFPETVILYNTSDEHKAIAEFLQQEWKNNLNITLELENQEWATYLSSRNTGDFQVARAGWVGDYQDPNTFLDMFITGAGMNGGKYSNEIYDLLINEATTMSGSDRMEVLLQAEHILINEDQAVMPIYYYTTNNMIDTSKWGGWYKNTMDNHPTKNIYLR